MGMKSIRKMFCGCVARLMLPVNLKGALLVLLWSTMMFIYPVFMAYYVSKEPLLDAVLSHKYIYTRTLYVALPICLVIGLVADICVGKIQDHCCQHILCLHWMDYSMCLILCNT